MMSTSNADNSDGLRFVDPSVDLSIFFDVAEEVLKTGSKTLAIELAKRVLARFPAVEYAIGFDGVDDWIRIEDLEIENNGIDIELEVWIPGTDDGCEILGISNRSDESFLTLTKARSDNFEVHARYGNGDNRESVVLPRVESETWQEFRIWSAGDGFEIEVDGTRVGTVTDIGLEDGPFKFYLGKSSRRIRHFEGMVKRLKVLSGSEEIFNLQAGEDIEIEEDSDSAAVMGIHALKKGRFKKEFQV